MHHSTDGHRFWYQTFINHKFDECVIVDEQTNLFQLIDKKNAKENHTAHTIVS